MKNRRNRSFSPPKQPSAKPPAPSSTVAALFQRAVASHQAGQLSQAEALYRQVLQLSPAHPDALHYLGVLAHQVGQPAIAVELIDQAIQLNPNNVEAYSNRGIALQSLGQYQAALESLDRAILLQPDYAEAHSNRGIALYALRRYQEALESCDRAIQLKPDVAGVYSNRGIALHALRRYQEAIESCDRAIQLKPDYAEAYSNRASALQVLRQYQSALESCDRAIQLKPDFAGAYANRASALHGFERYQEALESSDRAIQLNPRLAEAHSTRGAALQALRQHQAALESYSRAIDVDPCCADAYCNRGNILYELQDCPAALESYNQALLLSPAREYLPGMILHMKRSICDWEDTEGQSRELEARIDRGEMAAYPFILLSLTDSPALQRKAAEIYARDKRPPGARAALPARRPRQRKIRVGYFSADFRHHAITYLMAGLFERHDRSQFEILAFSFGPDTGDEMRTRVSAAMDRFVDVQSLPDQAVAEFSRELEVDVAVDLMGFTRGSRPGIFAQRAAPIQVSYLGYPATMGADFIDYLIADSTLIPEASRRHYSEKIVYLPDSFQVTDSGQLIASTPCSRAQHGLPEQGFVFCCFNNNYKIAPATFDIWMRILARVEGSVLWLLEDNPVAGANLRKQAARRGIDPQRLIFAPRLPLPEHLSRQRLAGLFLDTLPFNAGATASPALWAGLPVLTRMGESFAGRMAASLLRAIDLPELVTTTDAAYEALAVDLALNPQRLHELRQKLERNRLTTPLFSTAAFTRHLEAAYTEMHARYHANLPPDHIHIARIQER
jgi:predicted O-linked N-acetylglucosamine transferase (SPINDLY family)